MASEPLFRFLQASNLELGRFCSASSHLDADQARLLVEAPLRAAERVFETALAERAELILLMGGVFSSSAPSTWGASFLARHCERVGRLGIEVCWLDCGEERRSGWPHFVALPENLRICDKSSRGPLRLTLRSGTVVEIYAAGEARTVLEQVEAAPSPGAPPFRIGALANPPSAGNVLNRPVDYWAVYAGDNADTYPAQYGMARSSGTTQPRHRGTTAAGGCLLVEVGPGYSLGAQRIETGSIRYHVERIHTDDSTNWEGFRRRLHARTDEVLNASTADAVLFSWQPTGHGPVIERLTCPSETDALEAELREAFGQRSPAAWIESILPEADSVQESRWMREGSPFGAFVRSLDSLSTGDATAVPLSRLIRGELPPLDPSISHVPRPHFETSLKAAARRHAAQVLSRRLK